MGKKKKSSPNNNWIHTIQWVPTHIKTHKTLGVSGLPLQECYFRSPIQTVEQGSCWKEGGFWWKKKRLRRFILFRKCQTWAFGGLVRYTPIAWIFFNNSDAEPCEWIETLESVRPSLLYPFFFLYLESVSQDNTTDFGDFFSLVLKSSWSLPWLEACV